MDLTDPKYADIADLLEIEPEQAWLPSPETLRKIDAVLEEFARTGRFISSCRAVGVAPSTVTQWRDLHDENEDRFLAAEVESIQLMEDYATRRATEGRRKEIYYQGEVVGEEYVASDQLLMFLLKANNPEKYRERQEVEHSGQIAGGGTLVLPAALSIEAWRDKYKPESLAAGDVIEGETLD